MSGSVNKVILVGNLGRDPESRTFQNGGKVVNLRIATSENWKDRNTGERREKTEWHSVAIFNEGLANVAERYLRKGSKVYIEGQLQTRTMLDSPGGGQGGGGGARGGGDWGGGGDDFAGQSSSRGGGFGGGGGSRGGGGDFPDDLDDDVPF